MPAALPVSGAPSVRVAVMASNLLDKALSPSWLAATVAAAVPRNRRRSRSGMSIIPGIRVRISISRLTSRHRGLCAQRLERRPQLRGEQLRILPHREVAAAVDLVEVGEGGEGASRPRFLRAHHFIGE